MTNTKVGGFGVQTLAEWQTEYQEVLKYGKLAGLTELEQDPAARVGAGHEARRRALQRQDADLARYVRGLAGSDRDPAPHM